MEKAHKAEVQIRALAYVNVITLLDEAVEFKKIEQDMSLLIYLKNLLKKGLPLVKRLPQVFLKKI